MALKRKTPETVSTDLTVNCQGETEKLAVVYNNLKPADFDAHVVRISQEVGEKFKDDENASGKIIGELNARLAQLLVREWDAEYALTLEDLAEANADRPGLLHGVIKGYHQAREAHVVKN